MTDLKSLPRTIGKFLISYLFCQRKTQITMPVAVSTPFRIDLYHEDRSSPSSVVSDSSDAEEDVHISCSNSEISDVNEQDGEEDIFGLLYRQTDEEMVKPLDQTIGKA